MEQENRSTAPKNKQYKMTAYRGENEKMAWIVFEKSESAWTILEVNTTYPDYFSKVMAKLYSARDKEAPYLPIINMALFQERA